MMYPIAVAMDATPTPIATPAELAIKIVYNGEMRRFPFAGTSFQALNDKVLEVLGLDKLTPVQLKYRDEDNDLITITTDVELKTAIVPGKLLRLEVIPVASSAPAPVTAEAQNPFFQAGETFPAPPGFQAVPPMMFPPFGGPGPCGRGRDWSKFKEEMKKKKKEMSPEEWAAFKKAKEEHKRGKEHMKGFHKMMKKGRKHGFYPGMFGPHPHPHGHRGGHHGHGFPPHPHGHRGGHHGFPHHGHGFPHGPRFGGPHPHPPHFTEGGDVPPVPPTAGVPPPPFAPPFGAPGFFPPHPFGHHFGHHHHPHAHGEKLIARHVKDVTVEDGTNIPAGIAFTKTWRVRNEGQPWPAACRLTYISRISSGDNMSGPEHVVVEGPVDSNQEIEISVPLVAPTKPGRYTGYWKMVTPDGRKFGQRLWVSIVVPSPAGSSSSDEDREADRFESLVDVVLSMGFTCKRHRVFRLLQKANGDVDKVCAILIEKQQKKDAKAAKVSARMTDC